MFLFQEYYETETRVLPRAPIHETSSGNHHQKSSPFLIFNATYEIYDTIPELFVPVNSRRKSETQKENTCLATVTSIPVAHQLPTIHSNSHALVLLRDEELGSGDNPNIKK